MKIYNHPDLCPIWNYMQVIRESDLRFLLVLDDYINMPDKQYSNEVKKGWWIFKKTRKILNNHYTDNELKTAWDNINYNFEEGTLDLSFEILKMECWEAYIKWRTDRMVQNYHRLFGKLKNKIEGLYKNYKIGDQAIQCLIVNEIPVRIVMKLQKIHNQEFKAFSDLYIKLTNILEYEDLLMIRLYLSEACDFEVKHLGSFNDELTSIERILSIQIDPHKVSVSKYFSYRKKAQDIIKESRKKKAA